MKTCLLFFTLQLLVLGSSFCSSSRTAQVLLVAPPETKVQKWRAADTGVLRRVGVLQLAPSDREPPPIGDHEGSEYLPSSTFGAEAVPEEQRPANEYLDLIRQPLFCWADEERGGGGLAIRLGATYMLFFLGVCFPIAGATFTQDGYLIQKVASANVGAAFVIFFLLIRLYSGWGFVGSRLQSKVIEYEETGWYDGNVQMKSESERARDLFLYRKSVKPVVDRIKVATLGVGGFILASCVALNLATSVKPIFDEYNPEMLKSLSYDEKLANVAARQSGGKPTYCDNRYYRAVANGGQGCN